MHASRALSFLQHRQAHTRQQPAILHTEQLDAAAVPLGHGSGDGQAQAAAALALVGYAEEAVEDTLAPGLRDARATVAHLEHGLIALPPQPHADGLARQ